MFNFSIIIFCVLFAYLFAKKPAWAIYFVIAALPLSYQVRTSLFGLPLTLLELMILLLFPVFLIRNKFNWWPDFCRQPFFWPTAAVLFFATISTFTSPNFIGGAGIWKAYFIEPVLFFVVVTNTIKTKKELPQLLWVLGISALYLSVIACWQKFSGWNMPEAFLKPDGSVDRVVSVFGYPNALGLYLGPIIILFTGFLRFGEKKILGQLAKIIVIVSSFVAIILAQSEAAIISVLAIWLMLLLINKKTRLLALAIIATALILFFAAPPINEYLTTKLLLRDYSGFIRRLIWTESWQMLRDNWLWGAGLAGYQAKIASYHLPTFEIYLYPHNIILNFWSELGIFGLFSFIWLGVVFIWKNIKNAITDNGRIISITLIAVILQMIIHGLVDAPYLKNDLSVLFWLILAFYVINDKIVNC